MAPRVVVCQCYRAGVVPMMNREMPVQNVGAVLHALIIVLDGWMWISYIIVSQTRLNRDFRWGMNMSTPARCHGYPTIHHGSSPLYLHGTYLSTF